MGFDSGNVVNSATQLAGKVGTVSGAINGVSAGVASRLSGVAPTTASRPSPFTAAQATTAVQNYKKNQDSSAFNSIVSNYQWIFTEITKAANNGNTGVTITTTNFDYTYIQPLLISYGYIVSDLPSAATNPSDTSLKYDITITWPSSVPTPITAITPTSFIAIQNSSYAVTFIPQGGQGPYTFSYTGNLPDNWTSSTAKNVNTFTIQGTSSNLGGGSLILKVVDSISQSFTATINWTVTQPAQIQADWNVTTVTSLNYIRNKPASLYIGSTSIPFPGTTGTVALTGITSIDGNAATVTDGVYTTGSYSNPSWITALAGTKITGNIAGNAATATKLAATKNINSVAFDGSADITLPSLVNNTSTVNLDSGVLTWNGGQGASINGAFGANGNGIQIRGSSLNPNGPGNIHILSDTSGHYNEITLNTSIGLRAATSDGTGGSTTPYTGITMTSTLITVNGTITMAGLVQFTGGTSGLSKASVGLTNVTNESKATMFTDSTLTGTTTLATANITTANITTDNITTANITQGTLTTVGASATSLVNKQYVDSRAFFALAIGF